MKLRENIRILYPEITDEQFKILKQTVDDNIDTPKDCFVCHDGCILPFDIKEECLAYKKLMREQWSHEERKARELLYFIDNTD